MSISTVQQTESVIHVHTSIPSFMDFLPVLVTTEHRVEFPMPYNRFSLVIYFKHSSIHIGLPWWLSGKEATCQCRDMGSIPGLGRSPGEGNSNPLQYSCPRNHKDRGVWRATVHGGRKMSHDLVTKQQQHLDFPIHPTLPLSPCYPYEIFCNRQ